MGPGPSAPATIADLTVGYLPAASAVALKPTVTLGNLTLGSSFRFLIPTAALSGTGILILGAVAIQLVTGLTFVELTRRWLGAFFTRRRAVERADTRP